MRPSNTPWQYGTERFKDTLGRLIERKKTCSRFAVKLELPLPDSKKLHPLSERLVSPGIMGAQLGAPIKSLNMIVLLWSEGHQGSPQLGLHDAKRCQSVGQLSPWFS